jgi:uncharacterized protein (DUF305 family)
MELSEGPRRGFLPTGWTLAALVVALCFLAGTLGWRLGQPSSPGRGSADVGFLYDMVNHHNQAVSMARIELVRGQVDDVKVFAQEIVQGQSYEIGLMDQMLDEWGYELEDTPETAMEWMDHPTSPDAMPGMASPAELELLRTAPDADAVFLALMADHHAGAVDMAERASREAGDADVRALARRMADSQRFEIRELLAAADRAELDRTPDGVKVERYDPATGAINPPLAEHGG